MKTVLNVGCVSYTGFVMLHSLRRSLSMVKKGTKGLQPPPPTPVSCKHTLAWLGTAGSLGGAKSMKFMGVVWMHLTVKLKAWIPFLLLRTLYHSPS
mmetsp:Transcript_113073/g.196330  ORF Transcript_113073/g.196330 Transcript_113073/m.196330 type:complete len:96 (-) Transcript_113073:241-528(-)